MSVTTCADPLDSEETKREKIFFSNLYKLLFIKNLVRGNEFHLNQNLISRGRETLTLSPLVQLHSLVFNSGQ